MDDELDLGSTMIDLTRVSLDQLRSLEPLGESVLAHSLRRLLTAADNPDETIAVWNSAI